MAAEITWLVQPIVTAQLTGVLGHVEMQYAAGLYSVRVLHQGMDATLDGRAISIKHVPIRLIRSVATFRESVTPKTQ